MIKNTYFHLGPAFINYSYLNKTISHQIKSGLITKINHQFESYIKLPVFLPKKYVEIKKIYSYSLFVESIETIKYSKKNVVITATLKILIYYLDKYFKNKLFISKKSIYKLVSINNIYRPITPKIKLEKIHIIANTYLIAKLHLIIT